jgi:transcription-repair coupling factor (superfamily II helicase)
MHQLRGRVGRSGQRAYAYLFHPKDKVLTEEAYERLRTIGESTELALVTYAIHHLGNKGYKSLLMHDKRVAELPFDYRLKYHATVHQLDNNKILSVTGAPEEILDKCSQIYSDSKIHHLTLNNLMLCQ